MPRDLSNPLPPDRGWPPWSYLAGCFWIEGFTWGLPFSSGVFQKYYTTHPPIAGADGVAAIGTCATGILYIVSVPVFAVLQKWPSQRKTCAILGISFLAIALVGASFANHVADLILTQGILYGLGGAMLYTPFVIHLGEWFVERKGLAFGLLWAGTGISGAVVPPLLEWGLSKYGFRTMLRTWAVAAVVIVLPLIFIMKGRLPIPAKGSPFSSNLDCFANPTFWILQCGNVIQGLGYFMPSIYLPVFARAVGLSTLTGTLSVSLLNFASAAGAILSGLATDHLHLSTVLLSLSLISSIAVFLIWGFATSQPVLLLFSIVYGLSAGGWSSTWTWCSVEVHKEAPRTEMGVLIGLFGAGRGLGSIVSGPLSESLLRYPAWGRELAGAYGTGYGIIIAFAGISAVFGSLGWLMRLRRPKMADTARPYNIAPETTMAVKEGISKAAE
ncbi:MFS monocarboxylate transporter [Nemania sp. FL0916]|nr:MFS monocarboxylate transporter [Nemania sp. FL0916]